MVLATTVTYKDPQQIANQVASELELELKQNDGINWACSGFAKAMQIALARVQACEEHESVLVVTTEAFEPMLDFSGDKETSKSAIVFGDGATALALTPGDHTFQVKDAFADIVNTDEFRELVTMSGVKEAVNVQRDRVQQCCLSMNGLQVFKLAPGLMSNSIQRSFDATGLHPDLVKGYIPHQANARFEPALQSSLVDRGWYDQRPRIIFDIEDCGNTGASSVPMAYEKYLQQFAAGDIIISPVAGGAPKVQDEQQFQHGMSYGAVTISVNDIL